LIQKTVSFHTLGCKLNQAETHALQTEFLDKGWSIVPFRQKADVSIINSCTVTNQADRKTRSAIYQAIKASPNGKIVVMGCMAQVDSENLSHIEGVDLILGNRDKFRIFEFIDTLPSVSESPIIHVSDDDVYPENIFISSSGRTRAYLKVQEGCANFCSYCIIPYARGKPVSRDFYSAVREAEKLVRQKGFQEIILTGIDIGAYQHQDKGLIHLIRELEKIGGLSRIRISSIEMNTLTDELIDHISQSGITAPHFHLSLQAGSDAILKAMNRRYTTADFRRKVDYIRHKLPIASIGTDVITGFPGETDALFHETLEYIRDIAFSYLHIFRYSPKIGTPAAIMKNQIPENIKIVRSEELHRLDKKLRFSYASGFLGKKVRVLWESDNENRVKGFNEYYIQTETHSIGAKLNQLDVVLIESVNGDILKGKIL
jgi:threonylcarbamoyladenosine tRNA methylthiotransferase MtaB